MEEENILIEQLNPETFQKMGYKDSDEDLIVKTTLDTEFDPNLDLIEFYVYDENQNQIFPNFPIPLTSYNVKNGDVLINPSKDLERYAFDQGTYHILYNFYKPRLGSNSNNKFFINEISSDRTELRLASNNISNDLIEGFTTSFIEYREFSEHFVDFYLNFGENKLAIANNLRLDKSADGTCTVLIKLYEPLPSEYDLKSTCWVVEKISDSQLYKVKFPFVFIEPNDFTYISGPNFNIEVKQQTGKTTQEFSYNTILDSNLTSSVSQIKNLLNKKQIDINVNYEDFSEFVHFSSAKTRLENFYYKAKLIEDLNVQINATSSAITSATTSSFAFSSSQASLVSRRDTIIENLDGYEYWLYTNSGSVYSWPKTNTEPPYILASTSSVAVVDWIGNADETDVNYGGLALSASNYDQNNQDWLYWSIPEYLRDDSDNRKYELFLDMVGQHYDNIWVYIKDVTNKFSADNRLEYGISKDLVAQAIRDFGIKLYSNKYNDSDLYTAFLGTTLSGSLFPYNNYTESLPVGTTGLEYIQTKVSSSNDPIPVDTINKRIYKRIYHNLPYLLKTKGTLTGLRALITSYGIPDTILRINEFGGKDRNESQDWDLEQRVFNYAFDTEGQYHFSSSFAPNTSWADKNGNTPKTVMFRFKTSGIPDSTHYSQSLFHANNGAYLLLEYTGSGLTSGSYSGSIPDPENSYGTLKFIADSITVDSASLYMPFFDGGWWSVMATVNTSSQTSSLYVANKIDENVGFSGSSIGLITDGQPWNNSTFIKFPSSASLTFESKDYVPFSGAYQEIRYYAPEISESVFYDFVMNPYSIEGNTLNSSPDQLLFRAALGTTLDTETTTSIHPKVSGSWVTTGSFNGGGSSFYLSSSNFVTNKEIIYQDQVVGGMQNRITDKIEAENLILGEIPSGSNPNIVALSPVGTIQQVSYQSQSYTPDVNYLEVAFSPQNQINDDINSQLGYFNLGEYIGDPRQMSSSATSYPDLDTLRDAYFDKYISSYDIRDFIRLMKFFDNSLFRMIKDFVPARTSLSSGVVIKQHLLERNRIRPTQTDTNTTITKTQGTGSDSGSMFFYSTKDLTQTGTLKPQSRNFNTGSGDTGQYEYNGGSSIYKFSGGAGGSVNRYNDIKYSPSASDYGYTGKLQFNLTQSYTQEISGSVSSISESSFPGFGSKTIINQHEYYNGEYDGSTIIATTQSLNPNASLYLKTLDSSVLYKPYFYSLGDGTKDYNTHKDQTITEEEFEGENLQPSAGEIFIAYNYSLSTNQREVKYIKIAYTDDNSNYIREFLKDSNKIELLIPENVGSVEYYYSSVDYQSNSALLVVNQFKGKPYITGSINGGSLQWSLEANGNWSSSDSTVQNIFVSTSSLNESTQIKYWNGTINDTQSLFNTGSDSLASNILTSTNNGTYQFTGGKLPNTRLWVTGSITVSSSITDWQGLAESSGTYAESWKNNTTVPPLGAGDAFSWSFAISESDLDTDYFYTASDTTGEGSQYNASTLTFGGPTIINNEEGTADLFWYYDDGLIFSALSNDNSSLVSLTNLTSSLYFTSSLVDPAVLVATASMAIPYTEGEIWRPYTVNYNGDGSQSIENFYSTGSYGMFYVEHKITQPNGSGQYAISSLNSNTAYIDITQSVSVNTASLSYSGTSSIKVFQGNVNNPNSIGSYKIEKNHILSEGPSTIIPFSGSVNGPFFSGDVIGLELGLIKDNLITGLTVTDYSMSIYVSSSETAGEISLPEYTAYSASTNTNIILPGYGYNSSIPFFKQPDLQPLFNNVLNSRESKYLFVADYSTGGTLPVNQSSILFREAAKAQVQDSNYTLERHINPRYDGTKIISNEINEWTPKDIGAYSKLPTIEYKDAYFLYFKKIKDLYPLVNDKTYLNTTYLIDGAANAVPPSIAGYGEDTVKNTYLLNNPVTLAFISSSDLSNQYSDFYNIYKRYEYPTPIMYSQTSSIGHANAIPLIAINRFALSPSAGTDVIHDYSFIAEGTSSVYSQVGETEGTPLNSNNSPYSWFLDPTASFIDDPFEVNGVDVVHTSSLYNIGNIGGINLIQSGAVTPVPFSMSTNEHKLSVETSFVTNVLNRANFSSNQAVMHTSTPELSVKFQLFSGSESIPFNFEDITLQVREVGKEEDTPLGTLIGRGPNNMIKWLANNGKLINNKNRTTIPRSFWSSKEEGYVLYIDEYSLRKFIEGKGIKANRKKLLGTVFTIKSNEIINQNGTYRWGITVDIFKSKTDASNNLFPSSYPGEVTPTKISLQSIRALEYSNLTSSADFWAISGSNPYYLQMNDNLINRSYGDDFRQDNIPYTASATEYFPSGVEPTGSQFPEIIYPLRLYENDEIRFGNNENYTYKIKSVINPADNIISGVPTLKIKLDKPVSEQLNLNFFLIRRWEEKADSFILNTPMPHNFENSGSGGNGIIYPTYPTDKVKESGSLIVTDLIDKGVIT